MKKKIVIGVIIILALICALSPIIYKEYMYGRGINEIRNGDYYEAQFTLKKGNTGSYYPVDARKYIEETEQYYRNTKYLIAYAAAKFSEECDDDLCVEAYLHYIPEDYSGEFAKEIKKLREEYTQRYAEYLEEALSLETKEPVPVATPKPTPIQVPPKSTDSSSSNSYSSNSYSSSSKKSSSSSKKYNDTYDDGYDDVYVDGEPDWDRYDLDDDYAMGADDAMDDLGEDW